MSHNTQKLMFYLIVMLLTIYPLFELFRKKLKWYVRWPLVIGIGCFFWLALSVKNIEDSEKRTSDLKADSLNIELTKATNLLIKKTDSTNQFMGELKKWGVTDSAGHPVQIQNYKPTFNTHINKADKVKIG
jgi:hypothetical protein